MKKFLTQNEPIKILILVVFILLFKVSNAQVSGDFILGSSNAWIFHAPQDTRTNLHIAPKINGQWKWGSVRIENDGKLYTLGMETYDLKSFRSVEINPYTAGSSVLKMLKPNGGFHQIYNDNSVFGVFNSITNNTALVISNQDNVGIGTLTPKEKLAVNGNIRAKEIKVEAGPWPDYVFEEDYNLESLPELEKFVKKNKHLPGVPKAAEVEGNGVSLGEMNRILLQKVEELTLHLITLDKSYGTLKMDNDQLKRELLELKEIVKSKGSN